MGKNKRRKLDAQPDKGQKADENRQRLPQKNAVKAAPPTKPTIPFQSEDRILLVGEGDFSFAKSIVENQGCCDVTATCLDSQDDLFEKYKPQAEDHIKYLEDEGQVVLYNINATNLNKDKALQKHGELFDVAIFNFPHVGGKSKDVNRQVRFNQELLVKFFTSVIPLLTATGTIVITLFEGEPYTLWNIRDLARHTGLEVQRSFKFMPEAYPGYSHARTLGNIDGGGGWKGEDRESRSYVFQKKKDATENAQVKTKSPRNRKKRPRKSDSSDDEW